MPRSRSQIKIFGIRTLPKEIQNEPLFVELEKVIEFVVAENELVCEVVEVSFVDIEMIKLINDETRGVDVATDVISFEPGKHDREKVAEVYVCYPVVEDKISEITGGASSEDHQKVLTRELIRLVVHGLLHANRYDHSTELEYGFEDSNPEPMYVEQERILKLIFEKFDPVG